MKNIFILSALLTAPLLQASSDAKKYVESYKEIGALVVADKDQKAKKYLEKLLKDNHSKFEIALAALQPFSLEPDKTNYKKIYKFFSKAFGVDLSTLRRIRKSI